MTVEAPVAPARPGALARLRKFIPAVLVFFGGLVLWELVVIVFDIQRFLLPKPSIIADTFIDEFSTVTYAGWLTLRKALLGFLIGTTLAVSTALLTARWPLVRDGMMPFAVAVNSTPIIALAPILNNWFPITSVWPGTFVVTLVVFFPVMINMMRGLTEVDDRVLELMSSYGSSPREVLVKVRIPNSLPFLLSALKVATTLSVIAAVVSEYFGGLRDTLGAYISQQAALFHFAEAWAAIIVASIAGIAFYLAIVLLEQWLIPWHASIRNIEGT